jgi:3-deoxy-D-manno-octulosonate 8-phosphate phosphatase KdsC-like HAD superfamily phosphatase
MKPGAVHAIVDGLWANVAAYMWASKYGIGFFEDREGKGLNYNLTIEIGAMLMTGRRCALLKDSTVDRMPTDLVGHIYKSVEISALTSISTTLHGWISEDLQLGRCPFCVAA